MKRSLAVSALPTFLLIAALGLICTLGQTFVTGLFAPDFQQRFDISLAEIGAGYGIVVALASVTLPLIGPPIWRLGGTAGFAGVVLAGTALSAWGLSAVGQSATALFLSLFGLRLMARHGASLIMELVVVQAEGAQRTRFAALAAMTYPATLICLPPLIALARDTHGFVQIWTGVMLACAAAALAAFAIAAVRRIKARRHATPDVLRPRKRISAAQAWQMIRQTDFLTLTWVYVIPLVTDTVLVLFLSAYAANGLPLAAYALGQIFGVIGLRVLQSRGLSLRTALFAHLVPLMTFFPVAASQSPLTPYILLGTLGLSIGTSNVLGLLAYAERLPKDELPLALSLRSTISMGASALSAAIAGRAIESPSGWAVLLAALAVSLLLAWGLLARLFRATLPQHDLT